MTDMKITALAPWFGSKRTLASTIVAEIGPHKTYWEPFCGSMAVLLAKPVCRQETVNDLHADIINLARVVADDRLGPKLYRRLRRSLFDECLLEDARKQLASTSARERPDVDRAYAYFCGCWIGRNGNAGLRETRNGGWVCVRWTSRGGTPGTRWAGAVQSIPAWRRRMRNVTILNRDGFSVIDKIEDEAGSAIYVDPPYLSKSDAYAHDFAPGDHERLAKLLARFKLARVVVSYYDDPALASLYPGWSKVNCYMSKATSLQNRRGGTSQVAPEVLLINGPSYTQASEPLFGGAS